MYFNKSLVFNSTERNVQVQDCMLEVARCSLVACMGSYFTPLEQDMMGYNRNHFNLVNGSSGAVLTLLTLIQCFRCFGIRAMCSNTSQRSQCNRNSPLQIKYIPILASYVRSVHNAAPSWIFLNIVNPKINVPSQILYFCTSIYFFQKCTVDKWMDNCIHYFLWHASHIYTITLRISSWLLCFLYISRPDNKTF